MNNCKETEKINEDKHFNVRSLFDLFEICAEGLSISKTFFDGTSVLEIVDERHFLRLTHDLNEANKINLEYTAQDLRPLRGKPVAENSFIGFIEGFYLVNENWHYLDPLQYGNKVKLSDVVLDEEFIKKRIIAWIFAD